MGADGHIKIWRSDVVRERFPDADELFQYFHTHYIHELDGVKYDHLYWGTGMEYIWSDPDDLDYHFGDVLPKELRPRVLELITWLDSPKNGTQWEVWT